MLACSAEHHHNRDKRKLPSITQETLSFSAVHFSTCSFDFIRFPSGKFSTTMSLAFSKLLVIFLRDKLFQFVILTITN